tara:strand:+ start:2710 stop:6588 length:3879 start_codon:yes stop_codon:yes gene_type:complete
VSQLFADDEAAYLKQLELEDEQDNQQSLSQGEEEDDEEAYLKRLEQEDAQDQDQTILSQEDTDNEEAYLRQLELEDAQADGVVSPAPVSATASVTQTSVAEEPITPAPNQDTAMIDEYLQDSNAFYSREYLSELDSQKLSEVLNEEQPSLVDKYYPVSGQGITPEQVDEISEGAELVDYIPSWREKSQSAIASGLQKTGIASDNFTAQSMAQDFVGNANATSLLEGFSAADFSPVNAVFALNEIARDVENISNREDSEATDYLLPATFAALSILEAGGITKGIAKVGKEMLRPAVDIAEDIEKKAFRKSKLGKSFKKLTDRRAAQEQTREAIFAERASKFDVTAAREASAASQAEKAAAAKVIADKNSDIQEDLIRQFEKNNDVVISSRGKDGKLRVDPKKAREAGKNIIDETAMIPDKGMSDEVSGLIMDARGQIGGFSNPRLLELVLDKSKLDAVTATIAKVKAANPEAFKGKKKVIDTLFDESVKGNLFASDELRAILNQYGVSMDDYIMMTVGSASKFGQGLQKFAAMKKAMGGQTARKGASESNEDELRRSAEGLNKIIKNIKRGENVVRGAMVSALATAARNFESALVRYPMEGLTNLMEEAIIRTARGFDSATAARADRAAVTRFTAGALEGIKEGATALTPFGKRAAFKDSFAMYGYTFGDKAKIKSTGAGAMAKMRGDKYTGLAGKDLSSDNAEFVDYLLGQKGFDKLASRFYDQVNEVMAYTGRGEGGLSDKVFEPIEDFVQFLNGPNRLQEFVTRRAYFRTDLSMAVKREWGIDLEDALQNGKIRDIMNDAPSVKPEGARPFAELMSEATDKALQKTYAAAPDFVPFKYALRTLNAIPGSTFVIPFPRFMFKAMEYVGEIVAGMPIAMVRKLFRQTEGGALGKSSRDAEMAARNIAGIAGLGMAYYAVGHENSPVNYKKVRTFVSDMVTDISAQYPLPQLMYIASWGKKFLEGGEGDAMAWYEGQGGGREFVKLFTGTNFRQNQGLGNLLDDFAALASDESRIGTGARMSQAAGRLLGDITTRILQPYSMVVDAERALGMRTTEVKDVRGDPDLDAGSAFRKGFMRPIKQRGYYDTVTGALEGGQRMLGITDEEGKPLLDFTQEAELPARQVATREDTMERLNPELKLLAGLSVVERDTPQQEFLQEIGFPVYEFDSKTGIGTLDRIINDSVNNFLPGVIDKYMRKAEQDRARGDSEQEIRIRIRERIKTRFNKLKAKIKRVSAKAGDDPGYIKALLKARRMPLEKQRRAIFEYEQKIGREVDLSSTKDLTAIAKIGSKLK